jgi:hypothetical protein
MIAMRIMVTTNIQNISDLTGIIEPSICGIAVTRVCEGRGARSVRLVWVRSCCAPLLYVG